MAQPYIGEIRMFAGTFAPLGWMFCEGQHVSISENEALFTLIGTTYGGNGQTTFALPDLRGRLPIHQGTGTGGSTYLVGQAAGTEAVTLTQNQIPAHNHSLLATSATADRRNPKGSLFAEAAEPAYAAPGTLVNLAGTTSPAGGSQPHPNVQPFLCIHFIISLFGIYPSPT
jgi:microcystin-dependent protein